MKILIASSSISLQGGIPSYNRELCNMLNKENDVHLLVEQDIDGSPGFSKVISIPDFDISNVDESQRLLGLLNSECYDVIINSNSHIISLLASYLTNKTNIIGTSHSLRYTESDTAAFNTEYIDTVIALSGYNKVYLDNKFNLGDKCKVVSNFVADKEDAQEIRVKKKKNDVLSIVYVGGGAPTKSPEIVVKVVRELLKTDLKFKFTWLGLNTPPLKKIQPFQDMCCLLPKDNRLDYRGRVSSVEAAEVISNANIFFSPSRREGCPMSLLEAMSVGVIPISADYNIANKEIITNGENGFIIPRNKVSAFVERISDIIKNHSKYYPIYDNSYDTFKTTLSYDVWLKKMENVLGAKTLNHNERLKAFDAKHYLSNLKRFNKMNKKNRLHMMINETLPSALSCFGLYLTYHRKKQ